MRYTQTPATVSMRKQTTRLRCRVLLYCPHRPSTASSRGDCGDATICIANHGRCLTPGGNTGTVEVLRPWPRDYFQHAHK